MPRIAVAVLVVATIGGAIGINTVRYPIVWEMVNASRTKTVDEIDLPEPAVTGSREPQTVDLSEVAPPPLGRDATREQGAAELPEPTSLDSAELDAPARRLSRTSSAEDSMHLVSDRSTEKISTTTGLAQGKTARQEFNDHGEGTRSTDLPSRTVPSPGRAETAVDPSISERFGSHEIERQRTPASPTAPIVFGPISRGDAAIESPSRRNVSRLSRPSPQANSQKWPAQVSPILKYAAQPSVENPATASTDERRLVPVVQRDDEPSADTSFDGDSMAVSRLPGVPTSDDTASWAMSPRSADSPIPVYPATGR